MPEPIQNRIEQSLREASVRYYKLVLLAGETGSGKTAALRAIAGKLDVDVINVNLALSTKLIELTARQRALRISPLFGAIVGKAGSVALLDNTEILFDRDLRQDPLRLLQGLARNRSIVASWNGRLIGDKLTYAEAGHIEHQTYDNAEALIVDMNETSGLEARERRQA
ncbi:BREX-3 system P-loop-containing protein BrxF [Hoeflea sp.]|uniref:BREX-3 system P-loop-containing protein BrxF n=1 Tax=Hoeflea sp. TaxID=1940281 RepID=UPI003B01FFE1